MKTEIQETELYKKFKAALNIQHDMRPGDNPFVVACCKIAEDYKAETLTKNSVVSTLTEDQQVWITFIAKLHAELVAKQIITPTQKLQVEQYIINQLT